MPLPFLLIFLGPELNLAEVGRSVSNMWHKPFLSLLYGMNAHGNLAD